MTVAAHHTHTPVLLAPVVELLLPEERRGSPDLRLIDGTLGLGGHTRALLVAAPAARVLGIDQDPGTIDRAVAGLGSLAARLTTRWTNFDRLTTTAREEGFMPADGILLDLGVSSPHLDDATRGFSFMADGPLDMRMDPTAELSASDLVNQLSEERLANLFYELGEERQSRRIARAIVARRPLHSTGDLVAAILTVMPHRPDQIHPATRSFMALRIAVNDELDRLRAVLPQIIATVRPGGRAAVIAFHSLEDRIVKEFFRTEAADCVCPPRTPVCICNHRATVRLVTRRAVQADSAEIAVNPRSRSARLRVVERLP